MKKFTAFLLIVLSLLTVGLVACNQTAPTTVLLRWENEESYVFNVNLNVATDNETFNSAANKKTANGTAYYKDAVISSASTAEVRPEAATGTYTVHLYFENGAYVLETEQNIVVGYAEKEAELLKAAGVETAEKPEGWGNVTAFQSVITSKTVFENSVRQHPLTSEKTVKGFYIGKAPAGFPADSEYFVEKNDYTVQCKYNFDNNTAEITKDGKTETQSLNVPATGKFIDASQLLLYARSLDKSTGMADSPSVTLFDPATGATAAMGFSCTSYKAWLNNDGEDLFATTSRVVMTVAGTAGTYMLADGVAANGKGLDTTTVETTPNVPKYTIVRFMRGYLTFELASYTEELASALS